MLEEVDHYIYIVERSSSENFVDLVVASGLDPVSDFRYSNFEGMDFSECNLQRFDFTGSDFSQATLGNADFRGSVITDAVFPPGYKAAIGTPGDPPLKSTLDKLIDLATNRSHAAERSEAIRKIHRFFPGSPVARRFIRERRSADKSRTVRNLAWELSGETEHPSLPLFETIVRSRQGEAVGVAIRDLLKKKNIDDLEYEYLSLHGFTQDIEVIQVLEKKGFKQRNLTRAFAFIVQNIFKRRIDDPFNYFISRANPKEISMLSEIIAAYPEEILSRNEEIINEYFDIVSSAAARLFDNESSYFYNNYDLINKIIRDGLPLSLEFCRKFFGRGPGPGINQEIYNKLVITPNNSKTFENIVINWVDLYLGSSEDEAEYRHHRTASEVVSLILDFHPYGVILKSDNWYSPSSDYSEKEIEIARDFLDFHGIHRRRNSRVAPTE